MPIVGQFGSLAGFGVFPGGALESIATVTVGSGGAANIEFTSIPGTYQHLQIRFIGRQTNSSVDGGFAKVQLNGDTGSNYNYHALWANGATVYADTSGTGTVMYPLRATTATQTASVFGAGVADILDYASSSKTTVIRALTGWDNNGSGLIYLNSNLWTSTAAVTSIKLTAGANDWAQHTTAALFGVRA
jgi:hypothetical protein